MPYEAARLYVTVGAETREAESALRAMGQKVDGFAQSLNTGLLQGAGIAAFNLALQGLVGSFGALKEAGIDYNGLLEQTRIAFTTMLAPVVNGFRDMEAGAKASFAMMQNLREFAAKTPFEFPELIKNTQRLMAMGFAAEEVIPQLEAIGNVSAAYGKGTEGINRMTLAIGQMSAATIVHKDDLNQLVDVGVPVWDILSDKTGKSATELMKLVEQGQISSDFFIQAFNEWSQHNFGDMMAQQSKTFTGALSNIQDALRDTIAGAAEPFFNRIRDGMVTLGDAMGTPTFKLWASAISAAMESAGKSFDTLIGNLSPLGDAIAAVFGKLTQGDVSGAFAELGTRVAGGLQAALDTVNAFGQGMFGAGWNLITQLGNGVAGAFDDVLNVVVDGLAGLAQMLIGQSPPPAGPLKDIDKGGEAAGKAWGDPFAMSLKAAADTGVAAVGTAVDGMKAKSKAVADQMHDIDNESKSLERSMRAVREQIDSVKDGFATQTKAIRENAETVKQGYADALTGVRDQMDAIKTSAQQQTDVITSQIEGIKDHYEKAMQATRDEIDQTKDRFQDQTRAAQDEIEAVKDHYAGALQAVRDEIDRVKDGFQDQTRAAQDQIEAIKDQYTAAIQAVKDRIDSVKSSYDAQAKAVEGQIAAIKTQYTDALDGVKQRMDAIKRAAESQLKPLQDQITAARDQIGALREQEDLQHKLQSAATAALRLRALGDPALRAQLAGQSAVLDVQDELLSVAEDIADAQKKLNDPTLTVTERARLQIKLQQLEIQKQLASMIDQSGVAEAARQDSMQSAQEAQLKITREIEDANRRIIEIPIETKIAAIKAQADAALTPLADQLKNLEAAQKAALDPLETSLKSIKLAQENALEPLQSQLKQLERDQKSALDPLQDHLKAIKREQDDALGALQTQLKGVERDQKAALDPLQDRLKAIKREEQDALSPLQDRLKQLQKDQKAALDPLQEKIKAIKAVEKEALAPLEQRVKDLSREATEAARTFDTMLETLQKQQEAALKPLDDQLKSYQAMKEALGIQKEDLADIKRGIDDAASAAKAAAKNGAPSVSLAPGTQRVTRKPLDPNAVVNAEDLKKKGAELADKLADGFKEQLEKRMGLIIGASIGAAIGGLAFGPIGAIAGAAIGGAIGEKLQARLAEMGITPDALLQGLSDLVVKIRDDLAPAFELFLTNANELFQVLRDNKDLIIGVAAGFASFLVISKIVAVVLALAAALGPVISAVEAIASIVAIGGSLEVGVSGVAAAFGVLGIEVGGAGGILGGIVALLGGPVTVAVVAISAVIGLLVAAWVGDWLGIQEATYGAWDAIKEAFAGIGDLGGWLSGQADNLGAAMATAWAGIVTSAESLGDDLAGAWQSIQNGAAEAWAAIKTKTAETWDAIKQKTSAVWDSIKSYLLSFWDAIPEDIRNDLVLIYNNLVERFDAIVTAVTTKVDAIKTAVSNSIDAVKQYLSDRWGEITTAVDTAWSNVSTSIQTTVDDVKQYLSDRWGEIAQAVDDTWTGIWEKLEPVVTTIKNALSTAWDAIKRTADTAWSGILRFFDDTFGKALRSLQDWIRDFAASWGTWTSDMIRKAKESGDSIIKGLWEGINGLRQWLIDQFWDFIRAFLAKVKEVLGIASPSTVFEEYGKAIVQGLMQGVKGLWEGATGFLATFIGYIGDFEHKVLDAFGIPQGGGNATPFERIGSALINGFKAGITAIWNGASPIVGWVGGLITEFVGRWYTGFGWQNATNDQTGELHNIGKAVIEAFWNGLKATVAGMLNWLKTDVVDKIPETIRHALGINSPSRVMYDLGVHTIQGLINGMRSRMNDLGGIQGMISKMIGGFGGNMGIPAAPEQVKNWLLSALNREHAPDSWLPALEIIARGESNNSPTAVNPTELFSGGKSLGHATGLMQVAQGTFDWLEPGGNIFDPIQNAIAAIRWIKFKYGDAWNVPGVRSVLSGGPYLPYRSGGITQEDISGVGPSGRRYMIHRDEGIFNAEQMRRLAPVSALASAGAQAGPTSVTHITFTGNVYGFRDFESHLVKSDTLNDARGRNVNIWSRGGN